jgi:hypothetical protein
MKISSKSTYIWPFIILFLTAVLIAFHFFDALIYKAYGYNDDKQYGLYVVIGIVLGIVLYFLLRITSVFLLQGSVKYLLLVLPFIFDVIWQIVVYKGYHFSIWPLFEGVFLYFSWYLLNYRYVASLEEDTIKYRNLFGHTGTIPVSAITKLEQKKSLLSVFREFKLLDITKKTGISFLDEHMDEYEINVFTKAFNNQKIFDTIIERANKVGNLKVRQYTS